MKIRSDKIFALGFPVVAVVALIMGVQHSGAKSAPPAAQLVQTTPISALQQPAHEGMITDTRCAAKHSASIARNATDCVRICVHGGAKFALIEGDAVYVLDGDLDQLKKLAGQRAKVTGVLSGNTIEVSSIVAES